HRGGRETRWKSDRIRRRGSKNSSDLRGGPGESRRALPHGLHGSLVHAEGKSQRMMGKAGVMEYAKDPPLNDADGVAFGFTGEVLIRVLRAGLNHGDLHMREDAVQYSPEVKTVPDLPMTIRHDGLGEIVEVGPDVKNLRVGDRVVVICSITCGFCKYCRTERQ